MKIQTTISLEPELLKNLDQILVTNGHHSLSDLIEDLLQRFLVESRAPRGDHNELEMINRNADRLNQEAEDVLTYQVEL
jgi:metal-responsive CopG/Arc/MetJ family transcriptional regulator